MSETLLPPSSPPTDLPIADFVISIFFLGLGGFLFFTLWKFNRAEPQSTRFVIALVGRRVLQPCLDIMLDISAMFSYFNEGDTTSGLIILAVLIMGSLSMSVMAAYTSTKKYKHLPRVPHHAAHMGWGCLAGLAQVGPSFLGWRTVQAWRDITDHPRWRYSKGPDDPGTTQAELEDFVSLVADMKNAVHFESLFEGGPQFALQTYLLVYDWENVTRRLLLLDSTAWLRIFSPAFSAAGLIMSQMDFLCENDRFCHHKWVRDKPLVMLCTMNDLLAQLVLRVIPLAVLLDHQSWVGVGSIVFGIVYAIAVTFQSQKEEGTAEQSCFDSILVSTLFSPHAFFFGMTCKPPSHHVPSDPWGNPWGSHPRLHAYARSAHLIPAGQAGRSTEAACPPEAASSLLRP